MRRERRALERRTFNATHGLDNAFVALKVHKALESLKVLVRLLEFKSALRVLQGEADAKSAALKRPAIFLVCTFAILSWAEAVRADPPHESAIAEEASIAITPQLGLDDALLTFERKYRDESATGRLQSAGRAFAEAALTDVSVLSAKLHAASNQERKPAALPPYIWPVYTSRRKRENWKRVLPGGVRPPEVSYQTFAVTLNGRGYIIAPSHGARADKRFYTPAKSDISLRVAAEREAKNAISLDRRPSDWPGKIVTLEGRLPTGENVVLKAAALRGREILPVILPDKQNSFHNAKRGVEVDYGRAEIFVLPLEWANPSHFKAARAAGFSGAPAIEQTPEGDVLIGHFIGHHIIKVGKTRIMLGIIEDYDSIRSAIERYEALPRKAKPRETSERS